MKQIVTILFILIFYGCNINNSKEADTDNKVRRYYLKAEIDNNKISEFFKDYDIFERKGIDKLTADTMEFPFFQVYSITDTTYNLKIFKKNNIKEYIIPKGNQTVYSFHDIYDGPRHIYSKIEGDEIIRYGYETNPYETENIIFPTGIEVVKRDTFYIFLLNSEKNCLDTFGINGKILPFQGVLKRDCSRCLIHYYSNDFNNDSLNHYYRYKKLNEYLSKQNPGNGIYGYKREFKYWRGFHNLKRII